MAQLDLPANAIGAAIAQVTRDANQAAIAAGGSASSQRLTDLSEEPVPYMENGAMRLRVKVVGELATLGETST